MPNDATIYNPSIVILENNLPKDYDPEEHDYPGMLEDESLFSDDYAYYLSSFIKNGRNIFHLEPELIELFNKTQIDNVILEDIVLPYDSFYLYFGEPANIKAPNYYGEYSEPFNLEHNKESEVFIEGAFIELNRDHLGDYQDISIMLVPEAYGDVAYSYPLNLTCHDNEGFVRKDIKNTILNVFKDSIYRNPFKNDLYNQKSNNHPVLGKGIDWHQAKKDWQPSAKKQSWEKTSLKSLKLIFNAILYLTSQESDVEEDYPSSYPQKLVSKAKSSKLKEAKRAESKLASQGYTKIKFVGRSVKKYFKNEGDNSNASSHWRRGHWRKQPYGSKKDGKTMTIWIKPTVVNKNTNPEQEVNGHIYNV